MKVYLAVVMVVFVLLFVPVPAIAVDILYAMMWILGGILLCVGRKYGRRLRSLPKLVLIAGSCGLGVAVSFSRAIMYGNRSFLYEYVSVMNSNFIVNIFAAVTIMTVLLVLTKRCVVQVCEAALRLNLDSRTQRIFFVEKELTDGVIISEEAWRRRKEIDSDMDFYSCMNGVAKFLLENVKFVFFLYFASVAGGSLSGIIYNGLGWQEALVEYSFHGLLNVILYAGMWIMIDGTVVYTME